MALKWERLPFPRFLWIPAPRALALNRFVNVGLAFLATTQGRFYSPVIAALVLRMYERMFCIERRLCAIALLIKHQEMRWWMKRWTLLKLLSHEPIWGDSDKTERVPLYLNGLPLFNRSDGINVNETPHSVIGLRIKSQTDFLIRSSFCRIDCFDYNSEIDAYT